MKHNENPPNGKTYHWNGKKMSNMYYVLQKKRHPMAKDFTPLAIFLKKG
jgi:hypothetical protein